MDFISILKNVGGVLATITTFVYVSGYLSLRARAFALGTDPHFSLAYEGYVFAGFRVLYVSLIILLILSPAILVARFIAKWLEKQNLPDALHNAGPWLLLVLLAVCTIVLTYEVLSVQGVLLREKNSPPGSLLETAVMGGSSGVIFMLALFFLAALSVLWLRTRFEAGPDPFAWILAAVVALQLFLLPTFHGAVYADRKVRVLAFAPASVKDLKDPLGVVDRTTDHVTLLGLDKKTDERRLVTVKIDALDGIPVKKIINLKTFLHNDLAHAEGKRGEIMPEKIKPKKTASENKAGAEAGVFQRMLDYLQITFETIGSLGDSAVGSGQIWSVEFDAFGKPGARHRIGTAGDLAWPVQGNAGRIYAIRQEHIVRIDGDGQSITEVDKQKQWIKLLGVTEQGDILGFVYEDGESVLTMLHPDGKITSSPAPKSEKKAEQKSILEQEDRAYAGGRSLAVGRSARGGRGFDVFYKKGEAPAVNLSDCGDDACGQPSLSPDFRTVLYVRKPRY